MHKMSILIDSDPEIDDSVAILFALASPRLSIKAITSVSDNLLADECSVNARKTLKLSGYREAAAIPVAKGRNMPLVRPYRKDPVSHVADSLGELHIPDSGTE